MTLDIELDPIGPDGVPISTTVWCSCCEEVYRVPFAQRHSWLCSCRLAKQAKDNLLVAAIYNVPPIVDFARPCVCEWVQVNAVTGRPITRDDLEQAEWEAGNCERNAPQSPY